MLRLRDIFPPGQVRKGDERVEAVEEEKIFGEKDTCL